MPSSSVVYLSRVKSDRIEDSSTCRVVILLTLSHFCFQAGKIGRLQTLSVIPTLPGDSISISVNGNTRLAGLRRSLITDAAMDLFAFYVPHRHVYPGRGEENLWLADDS